MDIPENTRDLYNIKLEPWLCLVAVYDEIFHTRHNLDMQAKIYNAKKSEK